MGPVGSNVLGSFRPRSAREAQDWVLTIPVRRAFKGPNMLSNKPWSMDKLHVTISTPQDKRSWGGGLHLLQVCMEGFYSPLKGGGAVRGEWGKIERENDSRWNSANFSKDVVGVQLGSPKA